jgi:Phage tail tube protein
MAGALDHQAGIIPEVTYGTPLTPTSFFELDQERTKHRWDPKVIQGTGMQVGDGGFDRASRSVAVIGQGSGELALDYQTRGMGRLIDSFFGTGVSTLVSGSTYQQLFHSGMTGSLLPARTLELGVVRADAAGTVDAYRYGGVTFPKLTIACDTGDIVKFTGEFDAKSQARSTSPATATYPAGMTTPFHYGLAAVTFGGSVTVPTTTTLATGGTAVTNFRNFTYELDNQADTDDWALGALRNQPRIAKRVGTLSIDARYDDAVYDDALVQHTTVPVTFTFTKTSEALSTGFATLQLVFPACKLDPADRPSPSQDTPSTSLSLRILKPDTGHAMYVVHRTADTAL